MEDRAPVPTSPVSVPAPREPEPPQAGSAELGDPAWLVRTGELYGRHAQAVDAMRHMAEGKTQRAAAEAAGITARQLQYWVLKDTGLQAMWRQARKLQAQAYFDKGMESAERLAGTKWAYNESAPVKALDASARWFLFAAARLNPGDFGEQTSKTQAVVVQINTNLDLGPGDPRGANGQPAIDAVYSLVVQPSAESQDPSIPPEAARPVKRAGGRPKGWRKGDPPGKFRGLGRKNPPKGGHTKPTMLETPGLEELEP